MEFELFLGDTSRGKLCKVQGYVNMGTNPRGVGPYEEGRHMYTLNGAAIVEEEALELLRELTGQYEKEAAEDEPAA